MCSDAEVGGSMSTPEGVPAGEPANDSGLSWVAVHAIAVTACVLGLFYYWFALADRYAVFLYGHLGATPFDAGTSSRYWMAGLVAAGVVLVVYAVANWVPGRLARAMRTRYDPPPWQRVWLLSAVPVAIGVVAITTRLNAPVLPTAVALSCVLTALSGLALALPAGGMAAHAPARLLALGLWAVGLWPDCKHSGRPGWSIGGPGPRRRQACTKHDGCTRVARATAKRLAGHSMTEARTGRQPVLCLWPGGRWAAVALALLCVSAHGSAGSAGVSRVGQIAPLADARRPRHSTRRRPRPAQRRPGSRLPGWVAAG